MLKTDYKYGEVYTIKNQFAPEDDKVGFRSLWSNDNGGVAMLTFKAGQGLTEHLAPAEVMVAVAEGAIDFNMMGTPHRIMAGQFLLIGAGVPHSVYAVEDSKVMLIKVKPD